MEAPLALPVSLSFLRSISKRDYLFRTQVNLAAYIQKRVSIIFIMNLAQRLQRLCARRYSERTNATVCHKRVPAMEKYK